MATSPTVMLNNGVEIPQLGFGVFKVKPTETVSAVTTALRVGYRHIDTAEMYGNEKEVGLAITASGLDRDDVFVTSKLNNNHHPYSDALAAFDRTLSDLGLEYVDLFLIHWPLPALATSSRRGAHSRACTGTTALGPSASLTFTPTTSAACLTRRSSSRQSTRSRRTPT